MSSSSLDGRDPAFAAGGWPLLPQKLEMALALARAHFKVEPADDNAMMSAGRGGLRV